MFLRDRKAFDLQVLDDIHARGTGHPKPATGPKAAEKVEQLPRTALWQGMWYCRGRLLMACAPA